MAIFRGGKRIGPFDIRGGISRGDFKSSAYHKTDKDPRFKMKANTDNTIGRFRSAMASAEGYARPARFAVRIELPTNLERILEQNVGFGEGQVDPGLASAARSSTTSAGIKSNNLAQLASQMGQQINIMCDSISMPAHDLQSEEHVTYGPPSQIVTGHGFTGTIGASFYADKFLRERHFFEAWQKMAVDMRTHRVGYLKDYAGKIQIFQLGSHDEGGGDRDVPTYGIEAIECYPETVSAVEYNYGSTNQLTRVTVGFQYKQWHNLSTDKIAGIEFGQDVQTQHEIAQPNRGLFGALPPEIQRTGRDVFNSAKNQVPIGRLFKGKLFPPFF